MRHTLIRFLIAALAVLTLGAPAPGMAGTAADPEIADPAGDVQWIPDGDLSYMDLRAAWFESIRDDGGNLEAFRFTIRNEAPRPADQPLLLMAAWTIADATTCTTQLEIFDNEPVEGAAGLYVLQYEASANVYSWCEGDSNVITLGPVTVIVLWDGRRVDFARSGAEYIATIPMAIFDGTRMEGIYAEGAVLKNPSVNTFKVLPTLLSIGVDYNESGRDFVLGS